MALSAALLAVSLALFAQEQRPTFRVKVDMVVLSFTVTDSKGHYINGLKPSDFRLSEDGIAQKINTFGEANKPPVQVLENGATRPLAASAETSVTENGDKVADVALRLLRRDQRVRALRYQQLHVSRICLRFRRHRRFRAWFGQSGFGGGLHFQPQSFSSRASHA